MCHLRILIILLKDFYDFYSISPSIKHYFPLIKGRGIKYYLFYKIRESKAGSDLKESGGEGMEWLQNQNLHDALAVATWESLYTHYG